MIKAYKNEFMENGLKEFKISEKSISLITSETTETVIDNSIKELRKVRLNSKKCNWHLLVSFLMSLGIDLVFAIPMIVFYYEGNAENVAVFRLYFYLFSGIAEILLFLLIPYGYIYETVYIEENEVEKINI